MVLKPVVELGVSEAFVRPRMVLKPVVELGVSEAYEILVKRLGEDRLPPIEALENEDWGRDLLLSHFEEVSDEDLAALGLRMNEAEAETDVLPREATG